MGLVEPFRPIIDGNEFTDHPLHLYRDGKWNSAKDMIVGVATEELATIEFIVPPGPDYEDLFGVMTFCILYVDFIRPKSLVLSYEVGKTSGLHSGGSTAFRLGGGREAFFRGKTIDSNDKLTEHNFRLMFDSNVYLVHVISRSEAQ